MLKSSNKKITTEKNKAKKITEEDKIEGFKQCMEKNIETIFAINKMASSINLKTGGRKRYCRKSVSFFSLTQFQ